MNVRNTRDIRYYLLLMDGWMDGWMDDIMLYSNFHYK
jgi:hypothetical protein